MIRHLAPVNRLARRVLLPLSKASFIAGLPLGARLLDVGCGNHGAGNSKWLNPSIQYYGIDIAPYNIDEADFAAAAEIHMCAPEEFAKELSRWGPVFDAIVSCHNIEHVYDPMGCMVGMAGALKRGGSLHMAFPSRGSVNFPSRIGVLNFYDDTTHRNVPDVDGLIDVAAVHGLELRVRRDPYRALWLRVLGFLLEPLSARRKRVLPGTTAFWGFESRLLFEKIR